MEPPTPARALPWYKRPAAVLGTLLLVFPVGLVLLTKSPWPRRRWKLPIAVVFGLIFAANLHYGLGLRMTFQGSGMLGFEIFHRSWHHRAVWAHRKAQRHRAATGSFLIEPATPIAEWPGFRGADRDGIVRAENLSLPWPEGGPRLLWEQPIGGGHASFAIAYGRAFTIEQRGDEEVVACYALDSGEELWAHSYPAKFYELLGGPGPRATPTVDAGRVYGLGATGVLTCLDAATGRPLWSRNILEDASAENLPWGMAASPLVHDGRVYAVPGGAGASVIAYDADSGQVVWKSGSHKAGYSSPIIADLQATPHLLVFDGDGLSAYAPADGRPLWHFPWKTSDDVNASQPIVVDDERVFISSGYGHGCALLRVQKHGNDLSAEQLWLNLNLKLKFSSGVLDDGHIYGLDESILTCIDVETGQRRWKGGRYGYGQLVWADGHLLIQCEDGDLALVEATPEAHREISRLEALGGKTWNHPAIADGKLLVRNDRQMMCFDLRATATSPQPAARASRSEP